MNEQDGIFRSERPAGIDHFLRAPLHLGVTALYGGEVKVRRTRPTAHRRGCAAAEADQHGGAAEYDELGAEGYLTFQHVLTTHVAKTTGNHDGLVIAANAMRSVTRRAPFKSTEV